MLSSEEIANLQERLAIHRRSLHIALEKRAHFGVADTPTHLMTEILDRRSEIRQIKATLRQYQVPVDDRDDDEERRAANPPSDHFRSPHTPPPPRSGSWSILKKLVAALVSLATIVSCIAAVVVIPQVQGLFALERPTPTITLVSANQDAAPILKATLLPSTGAVQSPTPFVVPATATILTVTNAPTEIPTVVSPTQAVAPTPNELAISSTQQKLPCTARISPSQGSKVWTYELPYTGSNQANFINISDPVTVKREQEDRSGNHWYLITNTSGYELGWLPMNMVEFTERC
jgi:hypothetical protein